MIYVLLIITVVLKPLGFGYDDYNYIDVINLQSQNYANPHGWEPGFMLIVTVSSWFDDLNFIALNVMIVTICYAFNSYVFYKLSPLISISLLWYFSHLFFYKEMTQFRAAIAYSIVLLSFYYLYINKIKTYIFLIILASLFHISSAIAVIAYIAVKIQKKTLLKLVIISTILSASGFFESVVFNITQVILDENAFNAYILDKEGFAKSLSLLNPTTIKYILFSLFFYYLSLRINNKEFNFLLSIYMLAPIWINIFSEFGTLASRPASIFAIFECALLSHIAYYFNKNIIIRLVIILLSITLLLLNFVLIKPVNMDILY
ncbi:EpsG family protein [Providencia rettgeri]|uniref:EpsG family protein n=1 Tax=Providencia rettgeri TaxID=587 RepID=UPI001D057E19